MNANRDPWMSFFEREDINPDIMALCEGLRIMSEQICDTISQQVEMFLRYSGRA